MASTVQEPPPTDPHRAPGSGQAGNGGWRNLVPPDNDRQAVLDYSPPPTSTAIWVVLFAITMMFAAFTSALVVRKGSSLDWQTFTLPSILYINTLLLIASGVTLEIARRRITTFMGRPQNQVASPALWLYVTLFLGLLFVAGQYIAWIELR